MFLNDILARTLGRVETIAPRRASRFESPAEFSEPFVADAPRMWTASSPDREAVSPPPATRLVALNREPVQTAPAPTAQLPSGPAGPVIHERLVRTEAAPPLPVAKQHSVTPVPSRSVVHPVPAPLPIPATVPERAHTAMPIETVMHERTHSRTETRTIEHQLESLSSQTIVERLAETTVPLLPPQPLTHDVAETPELQPQRPAVIAPAVRLASPERHPHLDAIAPLSAPANTIHVTIGRVDVKASAPSSTQQSHRRPGPVVALEDYLQRRERG